MRTVSVPVPVPAPSRRTLVAVLLAGAVALTLVLLLSRGGSDPDRGLGHANGISAQGLREFAASSTTPVFWAGAPSVRHLELTRTSAGNVFVRYLTPGVRAGDPRAVFTTVATYPLKSAYAVTAATAKRRGNESGRVPGGGIAVWDTKKPTSVYVASPDADVLVEVYDPSAVKARALALSGKVVPVR